MGLDQWVFKRIPENEKYNDDGELIECDDESLIYWRKCNQIHSWFDRVCEGVDNCGHHQITVDDLKNLREDCVKVLNDHSLAKELFPVMRGCFFGSYDYDEYYFEDLEWTKNKLDELLNEDLENEELYYFAWW